jgi:hypothetical protein
MDRQFVTKVSQGNIAEVKTGQLAPEKITNKKVG